MIKILFHIDILSGGGAEKVLCDLVNSMDRSKFRITVQTTWPVDPAPFLAPHITYRSVYPKQSSFYRALYRLEAALGLVYPLHMRGDYDIEAAYLECGPTKVLASSTNKRAARLAWVHCDLAKKTDDPVLFQKKSRRWYERYDRVVCVADSVRDSFVSLFGETPPAVTLYNTVDDGQIREKAAAPLPEGVGKRKLTLVSLGRLTAQKSYDRLLQVHKRLLDHGLDHDLWILGEGEDRAGLEAFIRDEGLDGSVTLFGFQSNPYPFVRAADLLVCSSLYEGFSTFVTEGLILGRPVVTTDCSGMGELLGESEYGLITENSAEGLFAGIKGLLEDRARLAHYERMAEQRGLDFRTGTLTRAAEDFLIQTLEERKPT